MSDSRENYRAYSTSLVNLYITKLYDGSSIYCRLDFPHRRLSDIAHIHLLQHLLLAQKQLCHIERAVQLLFFKLVAQFAHLSGKRRMSWEFAHVYTAAVRPMDSGVMIS